MPNHSSSRGDTPASEAAILQRIGRLFGGPQPRLAVGLGDDAAVLQRGALRGTSVVTTDLLVEGVHFDRRYVDLADAGYKALAVNVSDCAAMGARPALAFGNLGVPRGATLRQIDALLSGVQAAAREYGVTLAGGDTVAAPQWLLGFTLLGELQGAPLTRSGAQPGDGLWHSGVLGAAQAGLHLLCGGAPLQTAAAKSLAAAQRRPAAQVALGAWLQRRKLASAALDLSDSLSQCVLQLCGASGVGVRLDLAAYALDAGVGEFLQPRGDKSGRVRIPGRENPGGGALEFAGTAAFLLSSAEDYQLLFSAPESASARLLRGSPAPLRRIGTIAEAREGCRYRAPVGGWCKLTPAGYQHLG